jgi:aromatic ring-opening dioxygenase catalytic subunit (LigB family)
LCKQGPPKDLLIESDSIADERAHAQQMLEVWFLTQKSGLLKLCFAGVGECSKDIGRIVRLRQCVRSTCHYEQWKLLIWLRSKNMDDAFLDFCNLFPPILLNTIF